ncbi:pyridine nucleotide-disulfide oxidoreductase (plasmid) [Rhizobium leguminosarum]|uniref:FAD-dependent oxidoreductase n=1 Tax=Rhizobium leguminosarum TaxID=384 RepID=UPI00102F6942|nr:FAD-dependent oxidoreductase [Rhizobium leguminosarum]NKK93912.1 Rieske 2Fe-2S domain-containing protein [Rhizobium leguminosarum bv. viciae]TAU86581.1 pyridine nucleotide-disulfide oxidoreductase [Rhizobium leguminosarum]TAU99403.1 pyridine nucleotide-disulfide oxidoreductase [Rhizobium leguminosarum]TAW41441.1 pyridine nucleotide-disulfide oxidoreductase [Rhizobium leguminosarum]TAY26745.1 pyridine nucleotide-disulfide oxidoreductase [Rhizobium leguminosarum]
MSSNAKKSQKLDFGIGIPMSQLADGSMLAGRVGDEHVLLARRGEEIFAVGSVCTHYGAPLDGGLMVEDTVRCPWHHACFSLRTGEALRAPAFSPIPCYDVEQTDGRIRVRARRGPIARRSLPTSDGLPRSIVIVGGGAAGHAAAETLRNEGYDGRVTMLSADEAGPYDRPNLSKGYLSGNANESSIPLRSAEFYRAQDIDLKLRAQVSVLDTKARHVELKDGTRHAYDALLLATGADPVRLNAGDGRPPIHHLRTIADAHALTADAVESRRAVVLGAGFIGLEVTASLRARGVEVHVVGPGAIPMQRVLGDDLGRHIQALHESHGVTFHLGTTAAAIGANGVMLKNGEVLRADFVVAGIGVRPSLTLARQAGLKLDRGVMVDTYLETSIPRIFAAGDIARWPDRLTGENFRVEHWVVAERQGQTAARNMLGKRERFDCVPFFWTEQYDLSLAYVGHAEEWDETEIDGNLAQNDCTITYRRGGEKVAAAFIHRDLAGVRAELEFEQAMADRTLPT